MTAFDHDDEPLPDIGGHWVCITQIAERLLPKLCTIDAVICALETVMRRGQLRSLIPSCPEPTRIDPPEWTVLQLTVRDWPENWSLEVTDRETSELVSTSLCVWLLDYNRLWPTEPESIGVVPPAAPVADAPSPWWIRDIEFAIANGEIKFTGPFATISDARAFVEGALGKLKKGIPSDRAIERGIRNHRPHWVKA